MSYLCSLINKYITHEKKNIIYYLPDDNQFAANSPKQEVLYWLDGLYRFLLS